MSGGTRVLLIQPEWPARAFLMAEMEARGLESLGADSIHMALDLCMQRGFRPEVIVLDTTIYVPNPLETRQLLFLRGNAPLLLLRSAWDNAPATASLAPTLELRRPVTVGKIADAVVRLAKGVT